MRAMEQHPSGEHAAVIAQLAREASIELNFQDLKHLEASRSLLSPGKRVYISHLPKQRWDETMRACEKVHAAGFDPIPHIPVRLIESEAALDRLLERAVQSHVGEVLLIAGDYATAIGPYRQVADVLRADKLKQHGLNRVSFAGHPEGHPTIPHDEILRAQLEKAALAVSFKTTFVTQFFFEAVPFLSWATDMRAQGVNRARLIAGLAGPAGVASLLKFARRCGVGTSIRALMSRPSAFGQLLAEHGPEGVMQDLAVAYEDDASRFDGLHFFCFGGYLRTCVWLNNMATSA
jgi:methylenetetrahydrofolate reductase (NADPH)